LISENGLLENEVLKYKSGLRKRKTNRTTAENCDSTASPASEKYKYYGDGEAADSSNMLVINEFMKQRHVFFNNEEETVYE